MTAALRAAASNLSAAAAALGNSRAAPSKLQFAVAALAEAHVVQSAFHLAPPAELVAAQKLCVSWINDSSLTVEILDARSSPTAKRQQCHSPGNQLLHYLCGRPEKQMKTPEGERSTASLWFGCIRA
jgi:hypothetical protein